MHASILKFCDVGLERLDLKPSFALVGLRFELWGIVNLWESGGVMRGDGDFQFYIYFTSAVRASKVDFHLHFY